MEGNRNSVNLNALSVNMSDSEQAVKKIGGIFGDV
jgi:hypothetical protein